MFIDFGDVSTVAGTGVLAGVENFNAHNSRGRLHTLNFNTNQKCLKCTTMVKYALFSGHQKVSSY